MDAAGASPERTDTAPDAKRRCVFCLEAIQPGASVCPHCGSNLAPLQVFADKQAELETRLAALEREIGALQMASAGQAAAAEAPSSLPAASAAATVRPNFAWPHMADNIFLGLAALLAAHWLATTMPSGSRAVLRLVALVVALPFGFRFERHSESSTVSQVFAALAFGSLGTVAIGLLDMALAGRTPSPVSSQDVVASVTAITLSHFAGSALAYSLRRRAERAANAEAARMAASSTGGAAGSFRHIEPARIKSAAEAVKALYDAAAPLAAAAGALWAAFGHTLF